MKITKYAVVLRINFIFLILSKKVDMLQFRTRFERCVICKLFQGNLQIDKICVLLPPILKTVASYL